MPLITWELWLARDIVTDNPLPAAVVSSQIDALVGWLKRWVEF